MPSGEGLPSSFHAVTGEPSVTHQRGSALVVTFWWRLPSLGSRWNIESDPLSPWPPTYTNCWSGLIFTQLDWRSVTIRRTDVQVPFWTAGSSAPAVQALRPGSGATRPSFGPLVVRAKANR